MITIYAKNGTAKCQARKLTLSEEFMGVAKMVVEISSPEPIDFAIDDYIDYSYNSRRYLLKDLAKVKKQARRNTYGEAFVYTCTFYEQTWELENCPFLDLVPAQQTAVYSSLPDVTVYAKPQNIVERVQANLDSFYGENEWEVLIPNYITDPTVLELLDTYKDISLSQATCKGALDEIYKQWGLSWIFVTAYGRKQIYVAFAGDISNLFKYGKGQGLRAITVEQKDTATLATRIYPYGSTENLPARWYNEHPLDDDTKYIDEFQYIPNLMLPPSLWHGGTPDGNYVEDADAIAKYGLRPKAIYFEGGEYEKIMPSISGLTAKDIRDAKTETGDTENVPSTTLYPDATRMDRTLTGDSTMDNGVKPSDSGSSDDTETFSFDAAAKEITIVNSENGGPVTSFSGDEVTYVDKMFFPLDTVSLSKIAQYIISFAEGSVSLSLSSTTAALLDRFSITPLICAYAPNISTEVEILAEGTPLAMPSGGEAWSPSESLAHLFADAEAILKVYQSQMDALPFSAQLYLGFIIDYKFATAAEATYEIPVTINLSAGGGESVRGVTQIANRFTVKIKQIGFDIMSCKQSANENRQLNMKSGLCAGYSFNILKTQYNASDDSWTLTCYRTTDTDLKIAFPNTDRHIMPEDEFVLTGIEMPDIYVYAAMEKLYEQALLTLAELSKPKMVYAPEIDNQKMAASPQVLHAGMLLQTEDTDLDIPALLPVDSLQITEDGEKLRQYSVTLRNEKADSLLRQIVTIAHNEQGVSERQVSTAINQALGNYTSNQENEQGGGASGSSSISFQPQGTGNAITEIVESTPGIYIAKKEKTFVDLLSEQTVTGKKYLSSLLISGLLAIPTVTPSPDSADASRSFLWCDTTGNYAETPSGGGGGGGETLTVTKNGQSWLSYNGSQAVTLNLVVPTKVSDLDNDSGFLTASTLPIASANTLGGIKVGSGLSINATTGVLTATYTYTLPTASSSVKGGIKVGSTLTISNEVLNVVVGSVAQSNTGFVTGGDVYSAIAAAVTSALHYRGMSSTALTDGGTETAIIGGVALTPQSGDVVIYNGFEFLWENSVWNKLGDDSSYALKTIQINGDGTYITGGGDLTSARTLTLSNAVIASLALADSAVQPAALGDYVTLATAQTISGVKTFSTQQKFTVAQGTSPFTVASTTQVDKLNADLLDGLHSHEQRRLGNAKDTLGTNSIAYGYNADASGHYSLAIGYGTKASVDYSAVLGYNSEASGMRAYAFGHGNKAQTEYSFTFGGTGNYAGLMSGDTNKPYIKFAEYTPKALTYNSSTVYGIWNRYNDASSVTFTYNGTSYTVNWPSASPSYWRALNVIEVTGDIKVPVAAAPFERYYVRAGNGGSITTINLAQVVSLGNNLYALISAITNTTETWPSERPFNSSTKIGLWVLSSAANGGNAIAIGNNTRSAGSSSVTFGYQNVATGAYAFAFGYQAFASGMASFALGYLSLATGSYATALGFKSTAVGSYAISTGMSSLATGAYSLATGAYSTASNSDAIAMGSYSKAMHTNSKVLALYGVSGAESQTVFGKYNTQTTDALVVGWGTADNARANIMTLSTAGALTLASGLTLGGTITLPNASRIDFKDSNGVLRTAIQYTSSNDLYIGNGTSGATNGYTYIWGKGRIYFNASSDSTAKWIIFADKVMSGVNTILPPDTNTGTLGTANNKFLAAYATTFYGALSGNASTATKLETARTLWGQSFDGSANVSGSLTGVTDITASGLATLPNIHAATSLSIPKVAPDTTAAWYDSSHAYLWSDSEGNYAESASGGGGGGGETLTITKNGSAWLSYNGSTAVSLNLVVPTTLAELTDDSTHRLVTDTQITAWNAKYDKPHGGIPAADLAEAYLPLTAGASKALTGSLYFDSSSSSRGITWKDSSNVFASALMLGSDGYIYIGYNQITNGKNTHIYGNQITLNFGSSKQIVAYSTYFRPATNGDVSLGTSTLKWKELYATTLYGNIDLSYVQNADDLKAIEAITETYGFLKKTAANTWALTNDIEASSLKTSTESSPMFTFRQTPSVAIGDSLTLTKIKGKTLVWNQQLKDLTSTNYWGTNAGTPTYSNGVCTFTATASGGNVSTNLQNTPIVGHKYYLSCWIKATSSVSVRLRMFGGYCDRYITANGSWQHFSEVYTLTTAGLNFAVWDSRASGWDAISFKGYECKDLTKEFGSGNEPTLEVFEALYGLGYYNYNSGSLLSLTASALQTTGKNIWDEEWENGTLNTTTGYNSGTGNTQIRSKNYIPVFGGTEYYLRTPLVTNKNSSRAWVCLYDANQQILTTPTVIGASGTSGNAVAVRGAFTPPTEAKYMRFYMQTAYGAIYNSDICINKSDTTFNGTYEPYKSNVARLDITTLKVKSPNIWDEEWEVGIYSSTDGQPDNSYTNNIRSKNAIPVLPSTTYYIYTGVGQVKVLYYTSADGFISVTSTAAAYAFTTPSNAAFIRFNTNNAYGATYRSDITINLSNPGHNGHYYPHGEFAPYADGMKDAGTAYDELRSKSTTRRMAKVDLGTLTYILYSSANHTFRCTIPGKKKAEGNCICSNYVQSSVSKDAMADKEMQGIAGYEYLYIRDTAYSDATAFQTAMSGVYLIYEQANPEDFELVTPLDLMIPSDALGTQRLLPENGATPTTAPMVAEITYGANIGDVVGNIDTQLEVLNNRINTFGFDNLASHPTTLSGYGITDAVPSSRKVNNKALSSDITLTLDDLADGSTRKLADYLPLAGGTLTGNLLTTNIYPSSNLGGALGSTSLRFGNAWLGQELHLDDSATVCGIYRGASTQAMRMLATTLRLGEGYAVSGGYTDIYGEQIRLYYSTSKTLGLTLDSSGTIIASGAMRIAGNIRPNSATNTNSIGQANYPFTNIYGKTITASTSLLANGTLSVTGAATLSSTLSVTGAATLSSTLGVTGVATFNNDVLISASSAKLKFSGQDSGLYFDSGNSTYLPFFKVDTFHSFHIGNSSLGTDIVLLNDTYATYIESHQFYSTGEVYSEGNLYCEGNLTAESGAYIQTLLTIPTSAPSNPLSSYAYLWIDTNGNYAELPNS